MGRDEREKLEEHGHFRVFRELLTDFPAGEVFHEDAPDFRVRSVGDELGIEHTRLFHPVSAGEKKPKQAFEKDRQEIVSLAQRHAELQDLPAVHVDVDFQPNFSIHHTRFQDTGIGIARVCAQHLPDFSSSTRVAGRRAQLPEGVRQVHIYRGSEKVKRHHWTCDLAGMVIEDSREVLQAAIDEKAARLPNYLEQVSSCWLLLVAECLSPSTAIEANKKTTEHLFQSRFERTFFLRLDVPELVELKTQ